MKNAIIAGAFVGLLSGLWIFIMHWSGVSTGPHTDNLKPIEYTSVLIPLVGLYFGARNYRENYLGGIMSFFEGLIECFKILLVGGIIAVAAAILYINYVNAGTIADFSAQMFGALLVGLLFSLAVSLALMNKSKAI